MDRVKRTPFLCWFDYHIWRIAYLSRIRIQNAGVHAAPMYEVVEKCRKCPATRTSYEENVPKKVKT